MIMITFPISAKIKWLVRHYKILTWKSSDW